MPVWMCKLSWGHQETRNQPTARYAAHVLHDEPPKARFNGANPKSKKETPSPNVSASRAARKRKNGNCPLTGSGADLGGGPDDGTQHHGRSRDEYGNGQHFHQVFITNVLLWPDVVRGLRPSLVSLRDLHSVSLAQEGVSANRFSSFPVDFTLLPCRLLDPPSGAGNEIS